MSIGSIERLRHEIDGNPLLERIDTRFYPGETIGLLGAPRAGKTHLLALLLGLGFPSEGEVLLWGERSTELKPRRRQRLGLAPQREELMPLLSGRDHLQLYRALRSAHWDQALVDKLAENWELPLSLAAHKMTRPQRQKLALLLSLAHRPNLLALDEPLASLTLEERIHILRQLIESTQNEQRTLIIASREAALLEPLVQRIWLLQGGRLIWDGEQQALKASVTEVKLAAEGEITEKPELDGLLGVEPRPWGARLVCREWTADKAQALAEQTGARVETGTLSLGAIAQALDAHPTETRP